VAFFRPLLCCVAGFPNAASTRPAGYGPDDNKRLFPGCDGIGKGSVRRFVGEVFFAGEESEEGTSLLGIVLADRPPQHGIAGLERVQHRTLRDRTIDLQRHFVADVREVSEV